MQRHGKGVATLIARRPAVIVAVTAVRYDEWMTLGLFERLLVFSRRRLSSPQNMSLPSFPRRLVAVLLLMASVLCFYGDASPQVQSRDYCRLALRHG